MDGEPVATPRRSRWIEDVSAPEIIIFAVWVVSEVALGAAATHALVRKALALPDHAHFGSQFLIHWGETWGGSMLLVAIVAGSLVFRRATPWEVVLTWPWLVGAGVGVGYFFALSGQMDAGSRLCHSRVGDCDTSWGLSAVLVALAAAVVLGGMFVSVASLKRLLFRSRR